MQCSCINPTPVCTCRGRSLILIPIHLSSLFAVFSMHTFNLYPHHYPSQCCHRPSGRNDLVVVHQVPTIFDPRHMLSIDYGKYHICYLVSLSLIIFSYSVAVTFVCQPARTTSSRTPSANEAIVLRRCDKSSRSRRHSTHPPTIVYSLGPYVRAFSLSIPYSAH